MKQKSAPVVRAVDVGYGHVKWLEGRDDTGLIIADGFPSQAPLVIEGKILAATRSRRDTFVVPVNENHYEVGRQVHMAYGKNQELEQLDDLFPLSYGYTAVLYTKYNYMLHKLPAGYICLLCTSGCV